MVKQFFDKKSPFRNNRGVALTVFMVLLLAIIPLVGISIDLSRVWHDRYRLEMAVRHAAFTGATELVRTRDAGNMNPGAARNRANASLRKNFPQASGSATVPANGGYVSVTARITIRQFFMPMFGGDQTITIPAKQRIQVFG